MMIHEGKRQTRGFDVATCADEIILSLMFSRPVQLVARALLQTIDLMISSSRPNTIRITMKHTSPVTVKANWAATEWISAIPESSQVCLSRIDWASVGTPAENPWPFVRIDK